MMSEYYLLKFSSLTFIVDLLR